MSYKPLHHKYRPQTFADLVGQETIALTLAQAIAAEKIAPAYLFTGPRGTGKTSSARILAKSLNCLASDRPTADPCGQCEACKAIASGTALDVMEIDAASNTGVDNIREIIERSRFAPVQCRYKVYAIDECHMLSTAAFNALLKTLEEPPPQVVFILATTDPQRVLSTIISRCQRFDYRRIPLKEMVKHLEYIAKAEKISVNDEALALIAQIANGGLRDAESLLDQLSLLPETITVEKVWDLVGAVPERDLLALLSAIKSDHHAIVLEQCRNLLDRGREPLIVLQNLASFYLNLLIAKTAPQSSNLVAVTEACWQELCTEATSWEISEILRGQQHLKEAETQIKQTTQPRLWLEVTLLGLLPSNYSQQSTGNSQQSTGNSQQATGNRQQATGNSQQSTGNSQQATVPQGHNINRQQGIENREKIEVNHQPSTINHQLKANDQKLVNDRVDEEIWQKVIDRLQPPTTKALLSQQCHLISFQGSSAVVGISSAKLQRLHQGKVANIEAAFEKVCQRKIKVRLEVASPTHQRFIDTSSSLSSESTPVSHVESIITSSSPATEPSAISQPKKARVESQAVEKVVPQPQSLENPPISEFNAKVASIDRNVTQSDRDITSNPMTSATPAKVLAQSKIEPVIDRFTISNSTLETNQQEDKTLVSNNENFNPDILQQAIEDLTQSFEGELVELDSINLSQVSDNLIKSDPTEAAEELTKANINTETESSTPKTTKNNIINIPPIDPKTVVSGRPDLSEYDDEEDIPF